MGSGATIYILSPIGTNCAIQTLVGKECTHRENGGSFTLL
jgi:hypothetical protein